MKSFIANALVVCGLALSLASCGDSGGAGGGGPTPGDASAIIGKSVSITPSSGGSTFSNVFIDSDTVAVTKSSPAALIVDGSKATTVETQTVTYDASGSIITYEAIFGDGTQIEVTLTVASDGSISSGAIAVNGVTVAASFTVSSPSNPGTAADALAAGLTALVGRDLVAARNAYCDELGDSPANSSLAFGCFWTKLMLLPTSGEAGSLLDALGEPLFVPATNYYGTDGIFTGVASVNGSLPFVFNYPDFNLPFSDFILTHASLDARQKMSKLIEIAVSHGVTTEDLQLMLQDLVPHFTELEALLAIVLADPSFAFTLPKQLFNVATDVTVTPTDAQLFMAGTSGSIFGLEILDSYDLGVDVTKVTPGGVFDNVVMLEDLNGTGATVHGVTVDTIAFGTLVNPTKIAGAKSRLRTALTLARAAFQDLDAGSTSEFFTRPFDESGYAESIAMVTDLNASITGGLTTLSAFSPEHTIKVDLQTFFASPPSATATPVSAGDPFILDFGNIQFVEGYFRDYLDGIVTF